MVADAVEGTEIASEEACGRIGDGPAFLEEDPVAQPLGALNLLFARCYARFERAGAGERRGKPGEIALLAKAIEGRPRD